MEAALGSLLLALGFWVFDGVARGVRDGIEGSEGSSETSTFYQPESSHPHRVEMMQRQIEYLEKLVNLSPAESGETAQPKVTEQVEQASNQPPAKFEIQPSSSSDESRKQREQQIAGVDKAYRRNYGIDKGTGDVEQYERVKGYWKQYLDDPNYVPPLEEVQQLKLKYPVPEAQTPNLMGKARGAYERLNQVPEQKRYVDTFLSDVYPYDGQSQVSSHGNKGVFTVNHGTWSGYGRDYFATTLVHETRHVYDSFLGQNFLLPGKSGQQAELSAFSAQIDFAKKIGRNDIAREISREDGLHYLKTRANGGNDIW